MAEHPCGDGPLPGQSDPHLQVSHHAQYLSLYCQPGEGREGVGISGGISPLFS